MCSEGSNMSFKQRSTPKKGSVILDNKKKKTNLDAETVETRGLDAENKKKLNNQKTEKEKILIFFF